MVLPVAETTRAVPTIAATEGEDAAHLAGVGLELAGRSEVEQVGHWRSCDRDHGHSSRVQ
jgi:hypothetical protein